MVKDSGKTMMRNTKVKNKASLEHLEYTVMAIEVDDPMDKMIKLNGNEQKLTFIDSYISPRSLSVKMLIFLDCIRSFINQQKTYALLIVDY